MVMAKKKKKRRDRDNSNNGEKGRMSRDGNNTWDGGEEELRWRWYWLRKREGDEVTLVAKQGKE